MTFKHELINPELAPWCEEVIIVPLLMEKTETQKLGTSVPSMTEQFEVK